MGRRRKRKSYERDVHGILLLDKPANITSNTALQRIKYIYRAARAGHTGSLDKPATGMLPLCFGAATKLSGYLLNADKTYVVEAKLGVVTSTGDSTGQVSETCSVPLLQQQDITKILVQFTGEIEQIPPMYSALKVNGQRLYKLAYQGVEIERKARPVTIYNIDLLHLDAESFGLKVNCSKGTYIRTLIADIGRAIGCGAHVSSLRRLSTCPFYEHQMVTMESIENLSMQSDSPDNNLDKLLLPADSALTHFAKVSLSTENILALRQGRTISMLSLSVVGLSAVGLIRLYDDSDTFIGIGMCADGKLMAKKLLHIQARLNQ